MTNCMYFDVVSMRNKACVKKKTDICMIFMTISCKP